MRTKAGAHLRSVGTPRPVGTSPRSFRAMQEIGGDEVRLHVSGEIDFGSAPAFERALLALSEAARRRPITLDLSKVAFIDAGGWRAVLAARERALRSGIEFTLVKPKGPAARVFEVLSPVS